LSAAGAPGTAVSREMVLRRSSWRDRRMAWVLDPRATARAGFGILPKTRPRCHPPAPHTVWTLRRS